MRWVHSKSILVLILETCHSEITLQSYCSGAVSSGKYLLKCPGGLEGDRLLHNVNTQLNSSSSENISILAQSSARVFSWILSFSNMMHVFSACNDILSPFSFIIIHLRTTQHTQTASKITYSLSRSFHKVLKS